MAGTCIPCLAGHRREGVGRSDMSLDPRWWLSIAEEKGEGEVLCAPYLRPTPVLLIHGVP